MRQLQGVFPKIRPKRSIPQFSLPLRRKMRDYYQFEEVLSVLPVSKVPFNWNGDRLGNDGRRAAPAAQEQDGEKTEARGNNG